MKHLRKRIFYTILVPTLTIYLIISSIVFINFRNTYKESMIKNKEIEVLNITRVLGDWISTRITELMVISNSLEVLKNQERYDFLSMELQKNRHVFDKFWIIDKDYNYRNTSYQTGIIFKIESFEQLFSTELLFSYIAPDEFWRYSNERILLFSVPITKNDEVVSILSGSFPLSELERVINLYTYNVFDEYALIDVYETIRGQLGGKIILHTDSQFNGTYELDLYKKVYSSSKYNKNKNYFVTDLINNWKLICLIDSDKLYAQLKLFRQFFIIITLAIIIVISLLSINISKSISQPVLLLKSMVNKMLQGDFKNEIRLNTQDELQDLADAFNLLNKRNLQLRTDDRFTFLGRISSRMAHEIRHPLHIIQIAMQTLTLDNHKKNKEIISQEIKKADFFIREILEIAKPNDLSLQYYSMNKLIESILNSLSLLKNEKEVTFEYSNTTNRDSCYFDVLKMEQVITNIINNSFDATEKFGLISINLYNDSEDNLAILITDTGQGFDDETINKVFDPFFTTKENGTGLGLSICYQIISAHGALIELSNKETGGAETKITFINKLGNYA